METKSEILMNGDVGKANKFIFSTESNAPYPLDMAETSVVDEHEHEVYEAKATKADFESSKEVSLKHGDSLNNIPDNYSNEDMDRLRQTSDVNSMTAVLGPQGKPSLYKGLPPIVIGLQKGNVTRAMDDATNNKITLKDSKESHENDNVSDQRNNGIMQTGLKYKHATDNRFIFPESVPKTVLLYQS